MAEMAQERDLPPISLHFQSQAELASSSTYPFLLLNNFSLGYGPGTAAPAAVIAPIMGVIISVNPGIAVQ
jgi:hypothetical protein